MLKSAFTLFILFIAHIAYTQNCFVFVGSYNMDKANEGIYVLELDTITGRLTKISSVSEVLNPGYLTVSPDGQFIYAGTAAKSQYMGHINSYGFDIKTKSLHFISNDITKGKNPIYVSTDLNGQWVALTNYATGSVCIIKVESNGKIESIRQEIFFKGSSINKERQEAPHTHSTVFSPDYKYLFVPDLGADRIWTLKFDSDATHPLSMAGFIKVKPGSGPRHLVFSPNGQYAYCTEELSGNVSAYKYNKGKLKHIQRIAAHADTVTTQFSGSDIHISPDGKYLYASNRGQENNLAIFSIAKNGKLKITGYQPTLGTIPRVFALSPTGKFIIVANQESGTIVVFKRDAKTGMLTYTGFSVDVPNPTCVKVRQY